MGKKKLTKEELIKAYFSEGKSYVEIASECGCTRSAVYYWMKEYKLSPRTCSEARILALKNNRVPGRNYQGLNELFFQKWSPGMAWILGLLYTDGTLYRNNISLNLIDYEVLEKVKKLLGFTGDIKRIRQSGNIERYIYSLRFSHKAVAADLRSLGLIERKSLVLVFPKIPENYTRHFIRGCWDGDGCFTGIVNEQREVNGQINSYLFGDIAASYVSGSYVFMEGIVSNLYKSGIYRTELRRPKGMNLKDWESEEYSIQCAYPSGKYPIKISSRKNVNSYEIRITSQQSLIRIFEYFYDKTDKSMYMKRKYGTLLLGLSRFKNRGLSVNNHLKSFDVNNPDVIKQYCTVKFTSYSHSL